MARKSKAKKASSKRAPSKKASKKTRAAGTSKKGRKSRRPGKISGLPGTRVVVVSTITLPTTLKTAFKNGYNDSGGSLTVDFIDNLGYDRPTLRQKFDQLNLDSSIALVVTVGGLIIFKVADNRSTKKFISLVGGQPDSHGNSFLGGVSLQSFKMNALRIDHLDELGFRKQEIGLFQNPNSDMADKERNRWRGGEVRRGGVDANGRNDPNTFANDLTLFASGIKAIVISADPFFQREKDKLVAAANNVAGSSGKYFCYPLQDYGGASPAPTPGKATLHGPTLSAPYRLLGVCASLVINSGTPMNPQFLMVDEEVNDL
jgi:hypothetical protein